MFRREAIRAVGLVAILIATATFTPAASGAEGDDLLPTEDGRVALRGDLHAHTAFSDGHGRPADAFDAARDAGLDFFAVTDHGEWLAFPFPAHSECIDPREERFLAPSCAETSTPLPGQTEYDRTGQAASAATGDGFVGLRGFEWSSPLEGHVNVLGTSLWTDSIQTGPAPMGPFYAWLAGQTQDPERVASFNHPGREPLVFDRFTHVPPADTYLGTIEAFNRDDPYTEEVLDALDQGWHVGTIGVSDGHGPGDWTAPGQGHTVLLASEHSRAGILQALREHRTVATLGSDLDGRMTVGDGETVASLGETLETTEGTTVGVQYRAEDFGDDAFTHLELVGPDGYTRDLPAGTPSLQGGLFVDLDDVGTTATGERYLALRAWQSGTPVLMTSPVWISTT